MTPNSTKLYNEAKALLGQSLGADNASDGYGTLACAESVNFIATRAIGTPIGGLNSTAAMYIALCDTARFTRVSSPLAGDIVISPTGMSTTNAAWHGHVGIAGEFGIMSNNSENGLWQEEYTTDSWKQSFAARGFPTYYFRVV